MIPLNTFTIEFDDVQYKITVYHRGLRELIEKQDRGKAFGGQKIIHPLKRDTTEKGCQYYIDGFVTAGVEDSILSDNVEFTFKHDGGCALALYTKDTGKHEPWTRRDVHGRVVDGQFEMGRNKWKNGGHTWIPNNEEIPKIWIPCTPKPTDPEATHWTFWRPCNDKGDKHCRTAFKNMVESCELDGITSSFTFEWMGRQFNGCGADPVELCGVPHGSIVLDIPKGLRSKAGFETMFKALAEQNFPMEGIIIDVGDRQYKIRTDVFLDGDKMFDWKKVDGVDRQPFILPGCNRTGITDYAALRPHEPCGCDFHKEEVDG